MFEYEAKGFDDKVVVDLESEAGNQLLKTSYEAHRWPAQEPSNAGADDLSNPFEKVRVVLESLEWKHCNLWIRGSCTNPTLWTRALSG